MGNHCIIFGNMFSGNQPKYGDNIIIWDNTSIVNAFSIGNGSIIDSDIVVANSAIIGDAVNVSHSVCIGSGVVIGHSVRFLKPHIIFPLSSQKTRGTLFKYGCPM